MKWFLFFLSFIIVSCTGSQKTATGIYLDGIYKDKQLKYYIGKLDKNWKLLSVKSVNLAFYNNINNGIIYITGKCKKSSDAPLFVLRTHLLIGFKDKKFLKSEKLIIEGREALNSIVIAKLDGVKRKINYFVLKKDGCLYDLVLISPIEYFNSNNREFLELIKNFKIIKGSNIKVFLD